MVIGGSELGSRNKRGRTAFLSSNLQPLACCVAAAAGVFCSSIMFLISLKRVKLIA